MRGQWVLAIGMAVLAVMSGIAPGRAAEAIVAVAANFATLGQSLADDFMTETGHRITLVTGATGALYAQIGHGAPFDLFLSADADRPARLMAEGQGAALITYAIGQLVLVDRSDEPATDPLTTLTATDRRIAIANPDTAPYGTAAREVLTGLRGAGDWDRNVVIGESIGQAYAFVATANTPLGLVAASQVLDMDFKANVTPIPETLYAPIRQDAVLLLRGQDNPAATGFFAYLTTPATRARIAAAGYTTDPAK